MSDITKVLNKLIASAHENSVVHGWWGPDSADNDGEKIALMHSELSEALEYIRNGNPPSDHIPEFSGVEEEMADVIIRVFDYCGARGYNLPGALLAKMGYNADCPIKHGGKKF